MLHHCLESVKVVDSSTKHFHKSSFSGYLIQETSELYEIECYLNVLEVLRSLAIVTEQDQLPINNLFVYSV